MLSPLSSSLATGWQHQFALLRPVLYSLDKLLNGGVAQRRQGVSGKGTLTTNAPLSCFGCWNRGEHIITRCPITSIVEPATQSPYLVIGFTTVENAAEDKASQTPVMPFLLYLGGHFAQSSRTARTDADQLVFQILQDNEEHAKLPDLKVAQVNIGLEN